MTYIVDNYGALSSGMIWEKLDSCLIGVGVEVRFR